VKRKKESIGDTVEGRLAITEKEKIAIGVLALEGGKR